MNIELYPWLKRPWNQLQGRRSNLPHALLVHGRPGLGKTALATLFGQRLLCEGPASGDLPCGACAACLWFVQGNHPDFRILEPEALSQPRAADEPRKREGEAASRQIRIDQVRELQDFLAIGTHRGGVRVVVVRPAEAMNVPTANALLKSLEEPPPGTVFLLVSSAPDRLLPTVRSRCQRIAVAAACGADAIAWLRARGVAQDAEAALAYAANAPLAALEDAAERAVRDAFVGGRLAGGTRDALELADACQGVAPSRVIVWLQKWTVDLVLARIAGRVRYHERHAPALRALAGSAAPDRLLRFERSLGEAAAVAQHPLNPRLFLEDIFLRYAQVWEARSG